MDEKNKMKSTLDIQVQERQNRKKIDNDMMLEQAEMWRMEREQFAKDETEHDKEYKKKLAQNANFLKT